MRGITIARTNVAAASVQGDMDSQGITFDMRGKNLQVE
jgi:hypothetical protein